MNFIKTIVAAGLVAASTSAFAADITGAGATFPFPVYSKWADAYKKETGNGLNYQSIGSGAGIKQIQAKTVTFGATDAPLKAEVLEKDGLVQWPMVMGAIVPVVNLEGIKPGELVLSGEVLGDIYLGKITKWDDAAIAKLNPKLKLPTDAITVVRRSDGSGTTFNFTDYLSKSNAEWKSKIGSGTAVEWPAGVGAKGNEGVAGSIRQLPGAIGYVELIYAVQNKIPYGAVKNAVGEFVMADLAGVSAAAAAASATMPDDFRVSITHAKGKGVYPISSFTWLLIPQKFTDASKRDAIKGFVTWMLADGQNYAENLSYAKLPKEVVAKELTALNKIQ